MLKSSIVFFLALFIGNADGQELRKIKIGYPAIFYNQIHIRIAKDAGIKATDRVRHTVGKRYPGDDKAGKTQGAVEFKSKLSKAIGFEPRVVNAMVGFQTITEVRA